MRHYIVCLVLGLCLCSLLISCISKPQPQEVKAASAESTLDTSRPTLTQQKMCADQAKKAFDDDQQDELQFGGSKPLSDYTSHFDPQKNLCYVRIHSVMTDKNGVTVTDIVYDAFERRMFRRPAACKRSPGEHEGLHTHGAYAASVLACSPPEQVGTLMMHNGRCCTSARRGPTKMQSWSAT